MAKICAYSGKKIGLMNCSTCKGKYMHDKYKYKMIKFEQEQAIPTIKCPFCSNIFKPYQQRPTTTGGNVARGAVFLPWGVVSAVKNKP